MRVVLQRVKEARVTVAGRLIGEIGHGMVLLVGIGHSDSAEEVSVLADKVANLRVFADAEGRSNLSALDVGAEVLVVSQFTLFADCRKGRRPSFTDAARPELAAPLIELFCEKLRGLGMKVATGEFQADMQVEICNSGPLTIWLDTDDLPRAR
ncbi:MAG: D-aminoacyl-tRNA deacylase [Acidobacteriota bacterium]